MAPVALIALGVAVVFPVSPSGAADAVGLGVADSFAILAGSGITNTGPTTIVGDVGSFPTPTQTGFGSVTLTGTNHADDTVTQQAKNDLVTAYDTAAAAGPPIAVPTELGGTVLTPGVYNSGTLGITGTLTLDAQGDPAAVWIFQASSTLITASSSTVSLLNGASACNVFWQVGSSATFGTSSHLVGTVLALTSITATTGATFEGRLLALNGAVTLDTNTVTNEACVTQVPPPTTTSTTTPAPAPTTPPTTEVPPTTAPGVGTPTGPPTLAVTGTDPWLPILAALTLGAGAVLLGVSSLRRRQPNS